MDNRDRTIPHVDEQHEARKPWVRPTVTELPKLTDLTLFTGVPIPGGGNTGGTVVF